MSIVLDALPIGRELMVFPPDEEGSQRAKSSQAEDDFPSNY
jgi:hypothetical protein